MSFKIYPTSEDALCGIREGALYVLEVNSHIAGTIILRHTPEEGYKNAIWKGLCIALRLDVVKGNIPASRLYQKCGFQYIDTVSLGYEAYGFPWYELYEKPL